MTVVNTAVKLGITIVMLMMLSACVGNPTSQPTLSEGDIDLLDAASTPSTNDLVYDQALVTLGEYINRNSSFVVNLQPKTIGNTAGGAELPINLTDMVITAMSRVAGDRLNILPFDPQFISNDFTTGGTGSRALPNYIVEGSITEFDKDFETSRRTEEVDLLIGGGTSETDTGFARDKSKRVSRVVIDLHLLDYSSHAVVPGVVVSNAILVVELEKQKDFGFAIYGSGIGTQGKIKQSQGFHRAVRNLVEYSVLQLLGKFYNMPYWEILGLDGVDPGITRSIRRTYTRQKPAGKMKVVQQQLNLVQPAPATQTANGKPYIRSKLGVDGQYGSKTYRSIESFISAFRPDINISSLPKKGQRLDTFTPEARRTMEEVYIALRTHVASTNLAMLPEMQEIRQDLQVAINDVKAPDLPEENSTDATELATGNSDKANRTSPKAFFDTFNKSENVYENKVYEQ